MQGVNVKPLVKVKFNQEPIGDLTAVEITDLGFIKIKVEKDGQFTNVIVGTLDDLSLVNSKLKFELIDELASEIEPLAESQGK